MGKRELEANGSGGGDGALSVRRPVVDDPTDRQIGEDGVVRAGVAGGGPAGCKNPVAFSGTNRVNSDQFLALVVLENPQVHMVQPRHAEGTNQCAHHLHDFHQLDAPPAGFAAGCGVTAGAEDEGFGGSGSQWSMIPTMVRSLG